MLLDLDSSEVARPAVSVNGLSSVNLRPLVGEKLTNYELIHSSKLNYQELPHVELTC